VHAYIGESISCAGPTHELLSTIERSCKELLSGAGGNVLRLTLR
jgi:hypothetical protein